MLLQLREIIIKILPKVSEVSEFPHLPKLITELNDIFLLFMKASGRKSNAGITVSFFWGEPFIIHICQYPFLFKRKW